MPARGTRGQHTSSVGVVVGVHCISLHQNDSNERKRPVVTAAGARPGGRVEYFDRWSRPCSSVPRQKRRSRTLQVGAYIRNDRDRHRLHRILIAQHSPTEPPRRARPKSALLRTAMSECHRTQPMVVNPGNFVWPSSTPTAAAHLSLPLLSLQAFGLNLILMISL